MPAELQGLHGPHGTNAGVQCMQAALGLSWHQKFMVLSKREMYWVSLGRVLWERKQLIATLQVAALQLAEQTEGEPSMWLHQPGPLRTQVIHYAQRTRDSVHSHGSHLKHRSPKRFVGGSPAKSSSSCGGMRSPWQEYRSSGVVFCWQISKSFCDSPEGNYI